MSAADLAARVTVAASAAADFERERHAFATGAGPRPEWADWAVRLSSAVRQLLAGIGDPAALEPPGTTLAPAATGVSPDGSAVVAAADLGVVVGALADAAACHSGHGGDHAVVPAYRRVSRALGDDR